MEKTLDEMTAEEIFDLDSDDVTLGRGGLAAVLENQEYDDWCKPTICNLNIWIPRKPTIFEHVTFREIENSVSILLYDFPIKQPSDDWTTTREFIARSCNEFSAWIWLPVYRYATCRLRSESDAQEFTESFLMNFQREHLEVLTELCTSSQWPESKCLRVLVRQMLPSSAHRQSLEPLAKSSRLTLFPWESMAFRIPTHQTSDPDEAFNWCWAFCLFSRVEAQIEQEFKPELLKDVSGRTGATERSSKRPLSLLKSKVKHRYVQLLKDHVRSTVSHTGELVPELIRLLSYLKK